MRRRPLPGSRGPKWMRYVSFRDINFWTNGIKREQRLSRWVKIVCCLSRYFVHSFVCCLFVLVGWFAVALLFCLLLLRPTTVKRYFFLIEYNLSYIVKKSMFQFWHILFQQSPMVVQCLSNWSFLRFFFVFFFSFGSDIRMHTPLFCHLYYNSMMFLYFLGPILRLLILLIFFLSLSLFPKKFPFRPRLKNKLSLRWFCIQPLP